MSVVKRNILAGTALANSVSGYAITAAALVEGVNTNRFSRTWGTPTSTDDYFISSWIKRNIISAGNQYYVCNSSGYGFSFQAADVLRWIDVSGRKDTSGVLRDDQWFHFAVSYSSTNSSLDIYLNGTIVTSLSVDTDPSSGANSTLNSSGATNYIGTYIGGDGVSFLVAEFQWFDGASIQNGDFTIDQFCEINNGNPEPVQPSFDTALYGDEGSYLGEGIATGVDSSGKGNDWAPIGITAVSSTPTDVATSFIPLMDEVNSYDLVLSEGNSKAGKSGVGIDTAHTTLTANADNDTYMEFLVDAIGSGEVQVGVILPNDTELSQSTEREIGVGSTGYAYRLNTGEKKNNGSSSSYGNSCTTSDVVGVRLNAGNLYFYKNGTIQNSGTAAYTGLSGNYYFAVSAERDGYVKLRTSDEWAQAPVGITEDNALKVSNLPDFNEGDVSNVHCQGTYSGTGAAQTINFTDDQGNAVTLPNGTQYKLHIRSLYVSTNHAVFTTVSGATKYLSTNTTSEEKTNVNTVTAMDESGFTVGADVNSLVNTSGETYVYWVEVAGVGTETDSNGTITSTVSAGKNLSIVKYSVPSSFGGGTRSVGHRGSQDARIPAWIIVKNLTDGSTQWVHNPYKAMGGVNYYGYYSTGTFTQDTGNTFWYDPTTTTIVMSSHNEVCGDNKDYIMYVYYDEPDTHCVVFDWKANNSADGPYNFLGGPPVWQMQKASDGATDWGVMSIVLDETNPRDVTVKPSSSGTSTAGFDATLFLSMGTKLTEASTFNVSSQNIIGVAYLKHRISPQFQPRGR